MSKKKILLKGPVLSRSGYGEQTRFILDSLVKADKYEIFLETMNWGNTCWIWEEGDKRNQIDDLLLKTIQYVADRGTFDLSIQTTIPNEFQFLADKNIGYTAGIETTRISPEWAMKANMMDHIIVVSEHSRDVFKSFSQGSLKTETPVTTCHFPRKETNDVELNLDLKTDFNFLTVAQISPRKNVENLIRWFIEEFEQDENVGLLAKVSRINNSYMDREAVEEFFKNILQDYPFRKCKLYLLHGSLTEDELTSLYKRPDVKGYITTTKGEGFGLPIFEAACEGLPVVSPYWSGQKDYLHKDGAGSLPLCLEVDYEIGPVDREAVWNSVVEPDSQWCHPKKDSFKTQLRELYNNESVHKERAEELKVWVREEFSKSKKEEEIIKVIDSVLSEGEN